MKLNNFFVMGAAAFAMTSGAVYAADSYEPAIADAVWQGTIGDSIPGSNLIITGELGGDIQRGVLYIEQDGTFTSSNVILEARDYTPAGGGIGGTDSEDIGERQPNAEWTYVSSQVLIGNQITSVAEIQVFDNETELVQNPTTPHTGGYVQLNVKNTKAITDVPVEGEAQVMVQMAASYESAI
ncbi:hypothetical protein AAFX33_13520 [Vibrio chagasii]|uniref:hypothetical protein n=1 Tax=Vibrio chagasii TaxID=170679 RepID=UPI0038CD6907